MRALGRLVPAGVDRRGLGLLSLGHLGSDLCQGAIPALLPFMVLERGYSYAAIGALLLCGSLGSSIVQPLFGIYADRIHASWLMPAGLLVSGAGIAAASFASSYALTAGCLLVGGLGVAAFHPEAVRFASHVSAAKRGAGMSLFAVGGNAGFALGPILVTPAVVVLGLRGAALVAVVPLLAGCAIWRSRAYLEGFRPASRTRRSVEGAPSEWRPFGLAAGAATLRTAFHFGLMAFVPTYVVTVLGGSEGAGNGAIAGMLGAGALGTLVGGRLADRFGFRTLVLWSLALAAPLAFAVPSVGVAGLVALLVVAGFVSDMNFYPLVVIAQEAVPRHVGFASGVVLGLSVGIGSLGAWLLGILGDHAGLTATLYGAAGLAAAAFVLGAALPRASGSPVRVRRASGEEAEASAG